MFGFKNMIFFKIQNFHQVKCYFLLSEVVLLFEKLEKRSVNKFIVRILMYWYQHQLFYIIWDNVVYEGFTASNGVRRG